MNELLGRAYLEQAVEKARKRNASRMTHDLRLRAERARDDAATFIAEHPFAAVAGGLVLGIAIGAALPRMKGGKALGALLSTVAEAGIAYGRQVWEASRDIAAQTGGTTDEKESLRA